MKRWYDIKAAAAGGDTLDISIFDEIGYWGVTAKEFIADFKAKRGNATKAHLSINSPGGSVFDGFAIFNALKASGLEIEVTIMGIAASMASVIAMVGKTITMPANAMMMVHNSISGVYGDAEDLRDVADTLDKIDNSIVATYVARTGKSEKEVRELMAADTFLSAAEALELGFATTVTDKQEVTARFDTTDLPENVRALFTVARAPTAPAPAAAPLGEQIAALATEQGVAEFAAVWAADAALASMDQVRAVIAEAREIQAVAKVVGRPDDAAALIRARKSLPEARTALAAAIAATDQHINTAPKPENEARGAATKFNPTALWAQIDAMNGRSK